MTYTECEKYMKNFFEQYYNKLSQNEIRIIRPLEEIDKEMWSDDADPSKEWKKWKLVPAEIDEQEILELEEELSVKLPLSLRAFLTVYHHFFEYPIGENPISDPFESIWNAWNPVLVKFGYLPFTWDQEGYFIRCIKLEKMPDEEQCGIYQIDHEILFDFDEDTVEKRDIDENMGFVSHNLFTYLDEILNDRDKDTLRKNAKKAILNTIKNECGITDYEDFAEKCDTDYESIYNKLKPIQEQYSLSDDDIEDILEVIEYDF
ncbi:MAG: hypothetical protein K2M91_02680 [Lachnospiraceae bacterium]|nr:hypothetical protein [Lachnospiraceae bacterium]